MRQLPCTWSSFKTLNITFGSKERPSASHLHISSGELLGCYIAFYEICSRTGQWNRSFAGSENGTLSQASNTVKRPRDFEPGAFFTHHVAHHTTGTSQRPGHLHLSDLTSCFVRTTKRSRVREVFGKE